MANSDEEESLVTSVFEFFDATSVGHLDYVQIEMALSALNIPLEYKYARELLKICDSNNDGRVDYQEFRRYMDDKELELYLILQTVDADLNGAVQPEVLLAVLA